MEWVGFCWCGLHTYTGYVGGMGGFSGNHIEIILQCMLHPLGCRLWDVLEYYAYQVGLVVNGQVS